MPIAFRTREISIEPEAHAEPLEPATSGPARMSPEAKIRPPLRTPDARVSAIGIAREVARAIERGVYAPGERLREQALANHFGCSRAPVREALRILESQGAVVIEPMRGARIAAVDDDAFREVFLIRRALSSMMAQCAAQCGEEAPRATLISLARGLRDQAQLGPKEFAASVRAVIRAFIAAADKPRAVQLIRGLTFGHDAFQLAIFEEPHERIVVAEIWGEIADAVAQADSGLARAAMERLFDLSFAHIDRIVHDQTDSELKP